MQGVSGNRNTLVVHNVEFASLERRRHLIFNDLHLDPVADMRFSLLDLGAPTDFDPDGRIEYEFCLTGEGCRFPLHPENGIINDLGYEGDRTTLTSYLKVISDDGSIDTDTFTYNILR